MNPKCATFQMKASEQFIHVALFINMLFKVVLSFKFVDESLDCDHSNEAIEQYWYCFLTSTLIGL